MFYNKNIFHRIYMLFFILIIVGYSEVFYGFSYVGINIQKRFNIFNYIWFAINLIIIFNYLYRKKGKIKKIQNKEIFIFIVVLILITIIGNNDFKTNIINIFQLIITITYAFSIINQFSDGEKIKIILYSFLIIMIINYYFIFKYPVEAVQFSDGRFIEWNGSFSHKNICGAVMALGCLFSSIIFIEKKDFKKISLMVILLGFYCLLKTQSMTGLCIYIIPLILIYIIKFVKKFNIANILLFMQSIFYLIILYGQEANNIFKQLFNRDLTLTGRTNIWNASIYAIKFKPFWGYGYGSFWNNEENLNIIYYLDYTHHFMGAHNGLLDLILQIGIIGLLSCLVLLFIIPCYKLKKSMQSNTKDINNHINYAFYIYILLYFISERSFFPSDYQTLFLFMSIYSINKSYNISLTK